MHISPCLPPGHHPPPLQDKIAYGGLPLREEKALVTQISKLRAQRERVAEYEQQAADIPALQAEANKVTTRPGGGGKGGGESEVAPGAARGGGGSSAPAP